MIDHLPKNKSGFNYDVCRSSISQTYFYLLP